MHLAVLGEQGPELGTSILENTNFHTNTVTGTTAKGNNEKCADTNTNTDFNVTRSF